ncbi:hypothetical protein SAMN05444360_11347 [Chryseobacterium carnipullorum]|uniref:hypothetical protein n=1 Tax=Chryseobacterium carnipullorum TaxID=1124835 RepID=UPI000912BA43|nr:hypothetical protein [Chryseobacterium carnipullorum]SHM52266.1 hypothetical protein SAMN05444360_11347 [Chryseobacterium carnipullorum]
MKFLKYLLPVYSLCIVVSCNKGTDNIPEISKGTLTKDWKYHNESMNFTIQLPNSWSFIDNENGFSKFIPMNQNAPGTILTGGKIKISKKLNITQEDAVYPLFSISNNSLDEVKSGLRKGDLVFAVVSSPSENAEKDIKLIKEELKKQFESNSDYLKLNKENLEATNNLQFGKTDKIPYLKVSIPDINGNITGNRMYALKNYESYNLLIIITYTTEEELQNIQSLLAEVK